MLVRVNRPAAAEPCEAAASRAPATDATVAEPWARAHGSAAAGRGAAAWAGVRTGTKPAASAKTAAPPSRRRQRLQSIGVVHLDRKLQV